MNSSSLTMLLAPLLLLGLVLAAPRPYTSEEFLEENGLGDLTARLQEKDIFSSRELVEAMKVKGREK